MGCGGSTPAAPDDPKSAADGAKVDCSGQSLTELPAIPPATTVLDCSGNGLAALPTSIGSLGKLTELDANGNGLTVLPAEIANCEALEKLLVYANQLKELPAKLPPNISELNLFNNKLKKLPPTIGELTELEEVNLAANKLMMTTDAMFASWSKVTVLNMYDNNLVRFGSLAPLTALQELRLNGNNLEEMPALGTHKSLTIIEIHKNRIAAIPDDYFDATPALERLSVWGNMLSALSPSLCRCSKLVGIQAQDNKIDSLPSGSWPATLETLFLQQNPLTTLPAELKACNALKRVNVSQLKLDGPGLEVAAALKDFCLKPGSDGIFWAPTGETMKAK